MAQTIISEQHKMWTSVGTAYYMWTNYLCEYDSITRSGNTVVLHGVHMKAWWTRGTTSAFYYYGTITYGFDLYINGNRVASASKTHPQGSTFREGTILAEKWVGDLTFTAAPGVTVIPVKIVGTGGADGDVTQGNVTFTIPPGIDPPSEPTGGSMSCGINSGREGASRATVSVGSVNYHCPAGNTCNNRISVVVSTSSSYSPAVYSDSTTASSKTSNIQNLTGNQKYYVKATITNGHYTTTRTCNFTTLASSSIFGYKYYTDQVSHISINTDKGGNFCATTTKAYIREKGTSSWQEIKSTTDYGVTVIELRNKIVRGKKYEAKTVSTNCAGAYESAIYEFAPPAGDSIISVIDKMDSELDDTGQQVNLTYCFTTTANTVDPISHDNPVQARLQFRVKGQGDWIDAEGFTLEQNSKRFCGTVENLACGTDYEFRVYQSFRGAITYSAVKVYSTAACGDVINCVCNNLFYATELICQELFQIKKGEKTIYANCDTKKLCDPYSMNPTWASILSRIIRWAQTITCLICSMDKLEMAAGEDDDIYTATERGQYGVWQKITQEVREGSGLIVSSKAVKDAINVMVHSVWRPLGNFTYFGWDMEFLGNEALHPQTNETAVVGNKVYKWNGSHWVEQGTVPDLGSFGVIKILKGAQYANSEFYYFNNEWNYMDFTKGEVGTRTDRAEDRAPTVVQTRPSETKYNFIVGQLTESNAVIWNRVEDKTRGSIVYLTDGALVENPFTLDVDSLDGPKELI